VAGHEGGYDIANFKFATGESLPKLHIHYSTLGTTMKPKSWKDRVAKLPAD
jgi:homoserine acetyltransferase